MVSSMGRTKNKPRPTRERVSGSGNWRVSHSADCRLAPTRRLGVHSVRCALAMAESQACTVLADTLYDVSYHFLLRHQRQWRTEADILARCADPQSLTSLTINATSRIRRNFLRPSGSGQAATSRSISPPRLRAPTQATPALPLPSPYRSN